MTAAPYVDVRETHTGVVVLVGDRAYKAKKPVLTDFLDFRTPEQRECACFREVKLNSRLSPNSYLGVAHLTGPTGGPSEPIVVMRRYHDDDRLASMVTRDRDGSAESVREVLDTIAAMLARFHEGAERSTVINAQGAAGAVDRRWHENLAELNWYAGMSFSGVSFESLTRIQRLATEFTLGRASLFTRRIAEGCILDGHGDLVADDIFCVEGEPAVLDCLEFDDQLRYVDRIDDTAFLAMDLEFLGRQDLGDHFLERYAAYSGDSAPSSLRDFYIAYRAVVRAKVDCLRVSQGKSEAANDAARHLAIATRHLENGSVRLALIGGNPGTGKSTVARALAEKVGARVISTDDVRRELREWGVITGDSGVLDEGLYRHNNVRAVYEEALDRASALLRNGHSVIVDGTWRNPYIRACAHRVASETNSAVVELMCSAMADVAADRITKRPPGNSDVTPEIAAALASQQSDWDTAYSVDTSRSLEHSIQTAHDAWRRAV
jgi:aminoglycoside phosphotransferase family enzyme/predicted kinase